MWRDVFTWLGGGGAALWLGYLTWRRDGRTGTNADGRLNLDSLTSTVDRLDREVSRLDKELDDERAAHGNTRRVLAQVIDQNRAHSEWDVKAAKVARQSDPAFPDPPRFVEPDFA